MIVRSLLFCYLLVLTSGAFSQKSRFSKTLYYAAMASDDLNLLKEQEEIVSATSLTQPNREAYEGALLMKKSGMLSKPREKLSVFKEGHKLLEKEIKNNGDNAELRFLRLMIQEHAPKIVHYRDNIEEDRQFITEHFNKLKPDVQQAILNYSKKYKTLQPSAFNQAPS